MNSSDATADNGRRAVIEDVRTHAGGVHGRVVFSRGAPQQAVVIPGLSDGVGTLGAAGQPAPIPPPPRALTGLEVHHVAHRRQLPSAPSADELAQDLCAYLDDHTAGQVVLAGHSFGAMLALHVAARRPQRVSALILSAPTVAADQPLRAGLDRWDEALRAGEGRAYRRAAIEDSYTGTVRDDALAALHEDPSADDAFSPAAVARHLALSHAARSHDAHGVVGSISAPTLVIAGGRDPLVPVASARSVATALQQARLEVFAGMAHGLAEQVPGRFAALVADFLQRHGIGAAGVAPSRA